jgi:hypothetical protein
MDDFSLRISKKPMMEGFMKSKISAVLAVCFILGFLPLATNGQRPEQQYRLFMVIDEVVKPSMAPKYLEASKKYIAFLKDHQYPYTINTYWTNDNHALWTIPIENYAEIDKIMAQTNKLMQESADAYKAVMDSIKGTYESTRLCVYALDLKYSMIAEEEMIESDEDNFIFFDTYYFEAGEEAEVNKILDEWKALVADIKIVQNWEFYWGMMGTDNPVLVTAASAKDPVEFWQENAKQWEAMGEGAGKIKQKMMKYVRKQEQKTGWFHKELSYAPPIKEE